MPLGGTRGMEKENRDKRKSINQPIRRVALSRKWWQWTEKYDDLSPLLLRQKDTVYLSILMRLSSSHTQLTPQFTEIRLCPSLHETLLVKSHWHLLSLLLKTTDVFQVSSWLLGSIKLCWPFQNFLKSLPLSSRTCSSLNSLALPPWPALWATLPFSVLWTVMFPRVLSWASATSSSVYTLFLGYLPHSHDLNYHLMLMASKSISSTPTQLPSEHLLEGPQARHIQHDPQVNLSPSLSQYFLSCSLSTNIPMAATEIWGCALPLSSPSLSSVQSPQCLSSLYFSMSPLLPITSGHHYLKSSGFLLISLYPICPLPTISTHLYTVARKVILE